MNFLGTPDIGATMFAGLTVASFATAFIGVFTGTAGGLILLALMAQVMPPAVLIPVHTVVQLGSGVTRTMIMWRYVLRSTLPPFIVGAGLGALTGAKAFVSLPTSSLEGILAVFILIVTWLPKLGRMGAERGRFFALGFVATFVGVFVSATGTLVAPFVASAAKDRRNHAATLGALMIFVHTAKIIAFGFLGFAIAAYIPLMVAMVGSGAVGNWVGEEALNRVSEQRFRLILQLFLTALGLQLLWHAAKTWGAF
jgi:uncharacterized protein